MHATLLNWLVRVTHPHITPGSFSLGIHIMDEFIRHNQIELNRFQLLGCTCVLLAAKLEQLVVSPLITRCSDVLNVIVCCDQIPSVGKFVKTADECFSVEDVVAMELEVLMQMAFEVVRPTRHLFLARFMLASKADFLQEFGGDRRSLYLQREASPTKEESFAQMMLDITLQYYIFNKFPMSLVAAAIVHLTHQVCRY